MKSRTVFTLSLFMLLTSMAVAQERAWWEPAEPQPGDSITIFYDAKVGTIPEGSEQVKLHWGINGAPGAWNPPPEEVWPEGTVAMADGQAVQSPMTLQGDDVWFIEVATLDTFDLLLFVFTNGSNWDNNSSQDWILYLGGGPEPEAHEDTVNVEMMVDLAPAVQNHGFTFGDTVEARLGAFGTADSVVTIDLLRQGISSYYRGNGEVTTTIGDTLDYTYYAYKNGSENWEVYYNYDYVGSIQSEPQYRQVLVTGSTISAEDTVRGNSMHGRRPPFFRNMSVIAQDVLVTLTCDVRPAYYHLFWDGTPLNDIQGTLDVVNPDDAINWGLAANGPITGSWENDTGTIGVRIC